MGSDGGDTRRAADSDARRAADSDAHQHREVVGEARGRSFASHSVGRAQSVWVFWSPTHHGPILFFLLISDPAVN